MKFSAILPLVVCLLSPAGAQQDDQGVSNAREALSRALQTRNLSGTQEALRSLVQANTGKAAEAVCGAIARVPHDDPSVYWTVVDAVASFTSEEALKEVCEYVGNNSGKPATRDLVYALQNNRSPFIAGVLAKELKDGSPECQVMAAEFLANVPTKETVEALIDKLEKVDKSPGVLHDRIVESLQQVTGKTLGDKGSAYRDWWNANKDKIKDSELGQGAAQKHTNGTAIDTLPPGKKEIERLKTKGTIVVLVSDCPMAGNKDAHAEADHDLDHVQELLKKMDLPYTEVKKSEFDKFELKGRTALLVNCNQWRRFDHGKTCKAGAFSGMRLFQCTGPGPHLTHDNKLSDAGVAKIKEFVEKDGGYLFTEDWVLPEILERAWPQYVMTGKYVKEMDVTVTPAPGVSSHPYMRRIFGRHLKPGSEKGLTTVVSKKEFDDVKHQWHIDNESPSIRITGRDKVIKLMVSKQVGEVTEPDDPVAKKPKVQMIPVMCSKCKNETEVDKWEYPGKHPNCPTCGVKGKEKEPMCANCAKRGTKMSCGCGGEYQPCKPKKEVMPAPPEGDEALAITFFPGASPNQVVATGGFEQDPTKFSGGGRVVHVMSHFGKQKSEEDEFSLQNLLLNFMIEANERRNARAKP